MSKVAVNVVSAISPPSARCRGRVALAFVCAFAALAAGPPPKDVEFRGRIVCGVEERAAASKQPVAAGHAHEWVFKTAEGRLAPLTRTKNSEALFVDARLRAKELVLKGQLREDGGFEAIVFQSVKDGERHSLFYWCDICTIRTITPGECVCCREPVELREVPVTRDKP